MRTFPMADTLLVWNMFCNIYLKQNTFTKYYTIDFGYKYIVLSGIFSQIDHVFVVIAHIIIPDTVYPWNA